MAVPVHSPTAAYQQSSVLTAPPGRLVVMLYDGARRFLFQAAVAMREDRVREAHQRLVRAEDILNELLATLDHDRGGEIASRLQGIYVFALRLLAEARVERDAERIDTVAGLLAELRDAFDQVAGC